MKVLLTALNARFIHTNLAIRYLKKSVEDVCPDTEIIEFTINHHIEYILPELYRVSPDVICFSCYIWNIEMILDLCDTIKRILPNITIILGGPEVSFETEDLMMKNDSIDIVVIGEGEITLNKLLKSLKDNEDYSQIPGLYYRVRGRILKTQGERIRPKINSLPFPYEGEQIDKDKIVYYESSRGCPFNCQYCLSSSFRGVDYLPIDRVKNELKHFLEVQVKQVKFVDRTFNAKKDYALEIMKFILENNNGITNFHFEVTADLIDEEMLDFLKTVPVGLFQFEIGVQSTNPETLKAIDRKMDFPLLSEVVEKIASYRNVHQHLDLIVGLPMDDFFSFRKSFNDVFALRPEKLQIGFLKLLKGSGLKMNASKYSYVYTSKPPYEVLQSNALSYGEITVLKAIEEIIETYWNSRMFRASIEFILQNFYSNDFSFFQGFSRYWWKNGYHHQPNGKNQLYKILLDYYEAEANDYLQVFKEILKFDYLKNTRTSSLPDFFHRETDDGFKNKCHEFLKQEDNLQKFLPGYIDTPAKQIIKRVHFERFKHNVIEIEDNPYLFKEPTEKNTTVLFDYDIENKSIDHSRYYEVYLND
ncbi:B12-binding domain-containing radical SAM protein [Alkaliphilus pronyensis]|uniref:B12-binding domain-containing radical SAM protein n=1 Tax=Alkaliphilus pronyensis TaxID=1482732 RepID=A0A6I0FAK0_9FIRM|nr:B12-binding domain-containing radical SAM protein [Alkaliphilus pronyensis]KAB3534372.1 B12-binding domain-containing radical SAM protein [Alkaliphilus pronyensis]